MKLWQLAAILVFFVALLAGIIFWRDTNTHWVGGENFQKNHDECHYEALKHAGFGRGYDDLFKACMKLRGWQREWKS
jgi:hypothetical protein